MGIIWDRGSTGLWLANNAQGYLHGFPVDLNLINVLRLLWICQRELSMYRAGYNQLSIVTPIM